MKVRMTAGITGVRHDGRYWPPPGGVIVVPDWEGAELCAQGYAEPVGETGEARAEKRPARRKNEKR